MDKNVKLLLLIRILRSIGGGALAVIVPLYYLYLNLSYIYIGILFAVATVFNPLIGTLYSIYSDIHGRKKVLILNLILLPLSILILLFSGNNIILLSIASALGGLGIAGALIGGGVGANVGPIINAMIADYVKDENEMVKSFSLFFSVAAIFGALGALLANIRSYFIVFMISFILTLIPVFLALFLDEVNNNNKNNNNHFDEKEIKYIRIFSMTGILNGLAQGFVTSFIPIILNRFYYLPQAIIGDLYFIGGILVGILIFLAPVLNRIFGFLYLIIVTRGISTFFLLLIPFARITLLAEISYLLYVLFRVLSLPPQQALMMELIKERRATSSSINQMARLIPSAIASGITGYLLLISFIIPFSLAFFFNIGNLFLYYHFFKDVPEAKKKEMNKIIISE